MANHLKGGLISNTLAKVAERREKLGAKAQKQISRKKSSPKKKRVVNKNKPGPKITTSKAKAKSQKEAIRKKIEDRIKANKKKKSKT